MSTHVHVRLDHGLTMNEKSELVELKGCQCGAVWTTTHWAEDDDPE